MFTGSMVALITPFKDGKVDWQSLERLIDFHIQSGTHGIVPCGTTGEVATLNAHEHRQVIEATVEASGGRARARSVARRDPPRARCGRPPRDARARDGRPACNCRA